MWLFLTHTKERIHIMNQQIQLSGLEITFLGKASVKTLGSSGDHIEWNGGTTGTRPWSNS